jgi:hypothetical protein
MDTETLRAMDLDDYVAWMLEAGRYDVDVTTGVVRNARTGRPLKPKLDNRRRYLVVRLSYGTCQRTVSVHRMVGIKLWGVQAVRGKEVGHRNGRRDINTVDELWLPATVVEHREHDGATKQAWPACVLCGDIDGRIPMGKRTPGRFTGASFGIDGQLCARCYQRLHKRRARAGHASRG